MSEEKQEEKTNTEKPKITINITFIVVVLVIAFTYIYVENGKIAYQEKIKAEQKIEQKNQKTQYEICITNADIEYLELWEQNCIKFKKKKDCSLPSYNADSLEKLRIEAKNRCMEKLKNNAF